MRILAVIGTRPEAIKMLPLVKELKKHSEFETLVCFSGQHETLADNVFDLFNVTPEYRFHGLNSKRTLTQMTIELLNYFDSLLKDVLPDIVLVHGDTTTALCAAISAFYLGIRVAHVEAGLRTFNHLSPFPEEFNRVAIDCISSLHFAPTNAAAQNLLKEGKSSVFITGNTGIDALNYTLSESYSHPLLNESHGKKLIILTTHRKENSGNKMRDALLGIRDALHNSKNVRVIFPAHPNPQISSIAEEVFTSTPNVTVTPPLPLYDFHNILARSHLIISDSGGIQEEAAYLGIPLLLLRDTTERGECVINGNVKIIGTNRPKVAFEISKALTNPNILRDMRKKSLVFGNGGASEKIVKKLLPLLKKDDIIK